MAFKHVGPEKSGPGPLGPGQFDPKQHRLQKVIPERTESEKDLSQRLMKAQASASAAPKPAAKRHPLGLPAGSVRALLCLIVVSFLVIQTARGVRIDVVWTEALMIMLAHYFTTRRFVSLSHELRAKLEAAGEIEPDESPLHLPKHSVRILLIAAFVGLGLYLHAHGRLFESQALSLLVSVGAYLLGITARGFLAWWSRHTGITSPAWWIDFKAVATLLIVLAAVGLQLVGAKEIHGVDASRLQDFSLGLVLYYFGSR
jgi:uncharacterized iron-regulated membrane protein